MIDSDAFTKIHGGEEAGRASTLAGAHLSYCNDLVPNTLTCYYYCRFRHTIAMANTKQTI